MTTALEEFIQDHSLRPKRLAQKAGLSVSVLYSIRVGFRLPDTDEAGRIVAALRECTGKQITVEDLWPAQPAESGK